MTKQIKTGLVSLYVFENNGVRFLASSLRKSGHKAVEVYFKDYLHHHFVPPSPKEYDLLLDFLKKQNLDLIGISLRAGAYLPVCIEVTQRIRNELKIPVMWGGPHVSMAPENCLDHADFIVMGEAEEAICDVVEALENDRDIIGIKNVWTKKEGELIRNPLRPLCQELDDIPFRDFHSHEQKFYIRDGKIHNGDPLVDERLFLMITSRGCAYNCAFCDVSALRHLYQDNGRFFRYRSVDNCLDELEYAMGVFKKLKKIRFDDELFVPEKSWIEEFAEKYPARIGLPFEILSDPRCLDDWTIEILKNAGMEAVLVGIQGSETVNRRLYNRNCSDDRVIEMARSLKRYGVHGVFQVITDDPETTLEEKHRLVELLLTLPKPYDLITFSLCHWPSSQRTRDLLEKGLIEKDQVEGQSNKVFTQFLADFSYKRSAEDTFFLALFGLANKVLVPRSLVRRFARSESLKKKPWPIVALATIANLGKLFTSGMILLFKGQISLNTIRRWKHIFSSPSI